MKLCLGTCLRKMAAIKTSEISKSYGDVQALRDISINIERGQVIGLLGPNGAGKTTLMKILTGYLQPDEGTAEIVGIDVVARPQRAQAHIGYLPENAPSYAEMAVQQYLQFIATLRKVPVDDAHEQISRAVVATGLERYLTRPISKLSKGYRQRVGIAQAILHRPDVLILDEPTTGLDPAQIVEIRQLIRELAEHSTVLLSTHILPEVEMTCDRVLMIAGGRLRADADLADLRASNVAVTAVSSDASGVAEALRTLDGVSAVEREDIRSGYTYWRVTGSGSDDLCPHIYQLARQYDWKLAELRPAPRTLESVFRELTKTSHAGVAQ